MTEKNILGLVDLRELAGKLSKSERQLFLGHAKEEWGSWMFEAGEHLVSLGLGTRHGGSIQFDTPLAKELRHYLLNQSTCPDCSAIESSIGLTNHAPGCPRIATQELVRPSRDETWLRVAEVISERGTCPRRQVGCVIVDNHGRCMATGYNGPASGRPHCSEGEPCPGAHYASGEGLDKCEAIHAEQNACLLLDNPWEVDTIYITASPCLSCVKLLLGTSAKRIVCRELYPHSDAVDWWHRAGRELIVLEKQRPVGFG